jgi:DtxR family Mn-dependent transcriptional regulator
MSSRGCKKNPSMDPDLSKALEMYVKVIHDLQLRSGSAAASDVAEQLGVKAPSVTAALRKLRELEMVEYEPYQEVRLTGRGVEVAERLEWRNKTILDFLLMVGVDESVARTDACEIEHIVHRETIERISEFLKKTQGKKRKNT